MTKLPNIRTVDTPQTTVNLGGVGVINFKFVESYPPNSIFAKLLNTSGVQTTPQLARGYMPGSSIDFLNNNLNHVCDFKFIFPDLKTIIGELGFQSPVEAIRDAIKNAKLAKIIYPDWNEKLFAAPKPTKGNPEFQILENIMGKNPAREFIAESKLYADRVYAPLKNKRQLHDMLFTKPYNLGKLTLNWRTYQ